MKRILIIEDDRNICKVLATRLYSWGYTVGMVHDATFAPTKAREFEPDLILMDIGLPGGDGISLKAILGGISELSRVPIVYITASKIPGLKDKAMSLGAVGFLEKPFHSQQLMDVISDAIAA